MCLLKTTEYFLLLTSVGVRRLLYFSKVFFTLKDASSERISASLYSWVSFIRVEITPGLLFLLLSSFSRAFRCLSTDRSSLSGRTKSPAKPTGFLVSLPRGSLVLSLPFVCYSGTVGSKTRHESTQQLHPTKENVIKKLSASSLSSSLSPS